MSTAFGSGMLELTVRGNLQLRAVTDVPAVAEAIAGAGLLPCPKHERVRNIVASPLTGRTGGRTDVRPWVSALDAAMLHREGGTGGRFWFSIDDGRGDLSGLGANVGVQDGEDGCAVLPAARDTGLRVTVDDVVPTLLDFARRFHEIRGKVWRINELDAIDGLLPGADVSAYPAVPRTQPPVGWIEPDRPGQEDRVALGAAVSLGVLSARVAERSAMHPLPCSGCSNSSTRVRRRRWRCWAARWASSARRSPNRNSSTDHAACRIWWCGAAAAAARWRPPPSMRSRATPNSEPGHTVGSKPRAR